MSLKEKATQGFIWNFGQKFGTQAISFIVTIVLARLLTPEDYGLIGMIAILMGVGTSLINSGLTTSLIRTNDADQEDYSTVFFFNLVGSILIYLLVFLSAPLFASFFNQALLEPIVRVYCLSFIISAFSTVQLTRLTKKMDFKTQLLVSIPSVIGSGILGVVLAYNGYGVWSLVYMHLAQTSLYSTQLWFRTKWRPSLMFSIPKFKQHFRFGYKLTLSGLLDTTFNNAYQIVIGRYFSASQVGFYTQALKLQQLPVNNISDTLKTVTYPLFATIQNDDARLRRVYKEIMVMVIFVIAPMLSIMIVLAEPLFRFLFSEKWLPAVPYFQILCLAGLFYPLHSYNLNILNVKGRSDLFLKLEVIKKIMIAIVIAITINFGIIGLVWGKVITSVVALVINTHYTGKFINYGLFKQLLDIAPPLLLALLMGICIYFINFLLPNLNDFLRLVSISLLGLSIYFCFATLAKMSALTSIKKILLKK